MRTVTFEVNQQKIKNTNTISRIYYGADNYLQFNFTFTSGWESCVVGIEFMVGDKKIPLIVKNGRCSVPSEAFDKNKAQLKFVLTGLRKDGYKIQSQPFIIEIGG